MKNITKQDKRNLFFLKSMNQIKWYTDIGILSVREDKHDSFGHAVLSQDEKANEKYEHSYESNSDIVAMAVIKRDVILRILENIKKEELNESSKYLRSLPYFKNLHPSLSRKLAKFSKEVHYNKGQIVFNQGDKSEYIHIVVEGLFEVFQKIENKIKNKEKEDKEQR